MAKHAIKKAKKFSTKSIVAIMAAAVIFCGLVGGTLAWLIDSTDPVVNTFTYGDINIKLDEAVLDENGEPTEERTEVGNTYKMVPGEVIYKDPTVTVKAGSENCYLFVKIEEAGGVTINDVTYDFDDYLTYTVAEGWTALADVPGVYYREVKDMLDATADASFKVLADDKVTVLDSVNKEMLNKLNSEIYPKLTFTGYAVQQAGMNTAAEAWAAINE